MSKKAVKLIQKVTWVGSIANIALAFIKITIGKLTGSQALIADGVHSFSDLVTDTAILIGSRYWTAPADKEHPYGHGRFETLTNIFIGFILAIVGLGIGWDSLHSISTQAHSQPGMLAFSAAVASIIVKEVLYRWTAIQAKSINSRALYANAWHHRSDALSSLPVAIAVIANYFFPSFHYLDQIAALIVTVMILKASFEILWPAILELTEAQADFDIEKQIQAYAAEDKDIKEVHEIRSRRTGSTILLDFHLLVDPEMSVERAHNITENFKTHLLKNLNEVVDIIIHIEPYNCQERMINPCCDDCSDKKE
ncbi:cation diffusion facilitator family transporter [Photobacterium toruni]|uniref:Cation diffusion facilitator family transporter n=1 Tax=Photobacterium toruni TaxID=1935446 RepID=A0ABU6L364_9GAMM|nr:cation diffusion facilitator family transporter [Photobacterium toruni]MEC6815207.1 cation diffusion facilitator family transporter [Photobacterium toruni]MEC6830932.1 cation diffusion facilitator family transporter [Photobacterium toruni]